MERDTTQSGMAGGRPRTPVAEDSASDQKRREREALERSFRSFQFKVGERTWSRAELHTRP